MAIDTPNKRKSVLNFSLPGLFLLPIPDGTIDSVNRRQMSDSYAITPFSITRNNWVRDRNSSQAWVRDKNSSNTWTRDKNASVTWVRDKDAT
jgi:hypothetical protein